MALGRREEEIRVDKLKMSVDERHTHTLPPKQIQTNLSRVPETHQTNNPT